MGEGWLRGMGRGNRGINLVPLFFLWVRSLVCDFCFLLPYLSTFDSISYGSILLPPPILTRPRYTDMAAKAVVIAVAAEGKCIAPSFHLPLFPSHELFPFVV